MQFRYPKKQLTKKSQEIFISGDDIKKYLFQGEIDLFVPTDLYQNITDVVRFRKGVDIGTQKDFDTTEMLRDIKLDFDMKNQKNTLMERILIHVSKIQLIPDSDFEFVLDNNNNLIKIEFKFNFDTYFHDYQDFIIIDFKNSDKELFVNEQLLKNAINHELYIIKENNEIEELKIKQKELFQKREEYKINHLNKINEDFKKQLTNEEIKILEMIF